MESKEEIPQVLYLYIHSKLYERTNGNHILPLKDAKNFLFQWKIPKKLRYLIIKELELLGRIEKINYLDIEIKRPEINLENPEHFDKIMKSLSLRND